MINKEKRLLEFNTRILIADDDPIQLHLYQKYLSKGICGYFSSSQQMQIPLDLQIFPDGAPLLACFRHEFEKGKRIPLCILDMRMDSLGGIETAQAVRAVDPDVFIILITSYEDISHDELMKNLKKDVYFMKKPVWVRELLAQVSSLIISWNSQQELRAAYREMDHIRGLLQIFIENTPAAVAMLDSRMHYIAHSRRWVSDLGLKKKDLRGCFHYDVLKDIPEQWKKEHIRCLCGETLKNCEEEYLRPDGSLDYVNRELHPLKDPNGKISGMIIFIEFITEKRRSEKAREEAEEKLREREIYLKAIMSAVQTSVMIIEPETYRITDANPYSLRMLGYEKKDLIGKDFYELRCHDGNISDPESRIVDDEYALRTKEGETIHVRRSVHRMTVKDRGYIVQSLLDMTDIHNLLKKQEISIDLAKRLLRMVNGIPPRNTALSPGIHLFSDAVYLPCYKEGGDHYFIRNLNPAETRGTNTLISVKDQSGHQVGCILRSIITDLIHHRIVEASPCLTPAEMVGRLNREICRSGVFKTQEFFTSLTAMIDHQTLELRYVSSGHPRFFLIRENRIFALPEHGSAGRNIPIPVLPEKRFSEGRYSLKTGDRLIFYTDGLSDIFAMPENDATPFENLQAVFADMIRQEPDSSVSDLIYGIFSRVPQSADMLLQSPLFQRAFPDDVTLVGLEIENSAQWFEKTLRPDSLDAVNDFVLQLYEDISAELKRRKFGMEDMALRSVLSEPCVNAWKHGNRENSSKVIRIRWRYGNDFHLEIQDEGEGFDFQQIYEPKCPKNVNQTSGRGLFIIRHYSDSLHWEDRGARIVIRIRKQRGDGLG